MAAHHPPSTSRRSFHGPKCWVVSALAGALLGLLLASFIHPVASSAGTHVSADAPIVIQTNADGTKVERLPDTTTRAISVLPLSSTPHSSTPQPIISATPATPATPAHAAPPLWLLLPFIALLASIALMPFISAPFWHHHFPDFAFFLGALVLAYSLAALGPSGRHDMLHAATEYYAFIALVGGLYVASGGILIDIRDKGTPLRNTLLLAAGCILANLVGTTGASVLLIRPFMRMNKGRLRPIHIVFFILTVSNCAGALTPIGDPPLYLGFLKGVPFFWTLEHMWPMWLLVNGLLLVAFYFVDLQSEPRGVSPRSFLSTPTPASPQPPTPNPYSTFNPKHVFDPQDRTPLITGWPAIVFLILLISGVFIDPLIKQWGGPSLAFLHNIPVGATFQILMALAAYFVARPSIRHSNQFTFEPVKEVGFLFVGIFLTMAPALSILSSSASSLGLETPTQYYFLTGSLSAVLDNAPTYVSFLQVALGTLHVPMTPEGIQQFIDSTYDLTHATGPLASTPIHFQGQVLLEGISLGAVFFGALTYIGNGPNFMVKSIVDAAYAQSQHPAAAPGQKALGTKMPSFFGYLLMATLILAPILMLNWFIFIR